MSQNYQEWLNKVEEDEFAGNKILEGEQFPGPACFHFQQVSEKCLKALLAFHDKRIPKTHDLIVLASLIEPIVVEIKDFKTHLEFLGRYYIETRYPGGFPIITLKEAEKAQKLASEFKNFVIQKLDND
ncbi:HEPN domain-containing protein [bacterium]|nr:MAG: HEPN domain-containing protein [bacterium]